ncbi:MAG: AMP-binding protein [bacterium]
MARDTIVDRFLKQGEKHPNRPAIWYNVDRTWKNYTWADYVNGARNFAGALLKVGFQTGGCTVIMGNNSPEWLIADVGTMVAAGSPAGIYQTSTKEQAHYIAGHCEATVWVIEDLAMFNAMELQGSWDALPHLKKVVMIREADLVERENVVGFQEFLDSGANNQAAVDKSIAAIEPDALATLIYTSGTTGPPKGVMLSHENLAFTAAQAVERIISVEPDDCVVSYLPLSHIAEQMFSLHLPITGGCPVWCCDDMSKVKDTMVIARPTIFLAVPRVWEKFKSALEGRFRAVTGAKAKIAEWAQGVCLEAGRITFEKGADAIPFGLKLQFAAAEKLFASKLRAALGLDRLRVAVTGAAPISKDVLEFFLSCGIPIHEVYGQSEGSGPGRFFDHVNADIERMNEKVARYEGIKKFALLHRDFSVEAGELTPTQKIKRKVVTTNYAEIIEGFYDGLD